MSETVTSNNPNPNLSSDDQFRSDGNEPVVEPVQAVQQQQADPTQAVEQQAQTVPDPKLETKPDASTESIGYDDFNALKDAFVPKEEPRPVVPQAKPEGAAQVQVKPGEVQKSDGTKAVARDYTGFEESEIPILKKMPNESFNWLRPQLLERKNLAKVLADKDKELAQLKSGKAQLPDSYFEHPQGFVLAPDYNEAATQLQRSAYVQRHWQNQLVKIRQSGDWQDLSFDKNGNPVLSQPQKATAEAEANVLGYINWASGQMQDKQRAVLNIEQGFRNRHSEALNVIKQTEKQYFAAYEDEKHPYMPVVKNFMQSLPSEFRNSPLAPLVAKAGAGIIQLLNVIRDKDLTIAKVQKENDEFKKAGVKPKVGQQPTNGDIVASSTAKVGGDGGSDTVTYDDFKMLKN